MGNNFLKFKFWKKKLIGNLQYQANDLLTKFKACRCDKKRSNPVQIPGENEQTNVRKKYKTRLDSFLAQLTDKSR